jgi:hypothetical protein
MSNKKPFGIWTLVAAVAWVTGLVLASRFVWRLWTSWYAR